MAQSEILRLEKVTLQYPHRTAPAVAEVSFALEPGDVLGLLGPSGCGKTTLLRVVAGFESPQAGSVEIAGRRVAGRGHWVPPEQRHVGIVFQNYALFPHLSVAENVGFGLRSAEGTGTSDGHKRATDLIALVGLVGLENRYPHELSGGQQQRVALARTLAPQPKLILLDEPLSNLDVQVRLKLREEVGEILKATETTAIFVTHDQQEALAIANKVAVMHRGRLEQLDTPEAIYTQPASRFVAEFITQANFLPAQRRGQVWQTAVGCFAVTASTLPLGEPPAPDTGELMIREEDLILQPHSDAPAVIKTRRFLGREYRYCLDTPCGELHARTTAETALPVGTRVQLTVQAQGLRFFPASELAVF